MVAMDFTLPFSMETKMHYLLAMVTFREEKCGS